MGVHSRFGDGNDGWVDIALRRSTDAGATWGALQIICRNSTFKADGSRDRALEHSCQQPTPVADAITGKVFFLSSMDNWYQRVIESADDGITWTPWAQATDLDATLRWPGWGLVFNGLVNAIPLCLVCHRLTLQLTQCWCLSAAGGDPAGDAQPARRPSRCLLECVLEWGRNEGRYVLFLLRLSLLACCVLTSSRRAQRRR